MNIDFNDTFLIILNFYFIYGNKAYHSQLKIFKLCITNILTKKN